MDEVWDCPADNRIRHHRRPQGASGLFSDALFRGAERAVRAARPHLRVLDKDRFRRDLGNVEGAYQEVMKRLTGSQP